MTQRSKSIWVCKEYEDGKLMAYLNKNNCPLYYTKWNLKLRCGMTSGCTAVKYMAVKKKGSGK